MRASQFLFEAPVTQNSPSAEKAIALMELLCFLLAIPNNQFLRKVIDLLSAACTQCRGHSRCKIIQVPLLASRAGVRNRLTEVLR